MRTSQSFSARMSRHILFITSCLFILAALVVALSSHYLIGQEASKNTTNALHSSVLEVEKTLTEVETAVENIGWIIASHTNDKAFLYKITQKIVAGNPNIVGSAIAFRDNYYQGVHFFSPYSYQDEQTQEIKSFQLGTDDYDYFSMEWFTIPFNTKKPHWSAPYYDQGGGQQMMTTYSVPLLDKHGNVFAIITADLNLDYLTQKVSKNKPYDNSYTIVLSPDGTYIANPDKSKIINQTIYDVAKKRNNQKICNLGDSMTAQREGILLFERRSFIVYGPVKNGWSIGIISPFKDVFARTARMNLIIFLVSLFGLFFLFLLCMRTIRKLSLPVTEFSVSALNMAKGNFNAHLPNITTQDEMRQLYDSFKYMQTSITTYISELKATTAMNERMGSELHIARAIQLGMVPNKFPSAADFDKNGFELHAFLRPAKEVGGDLYDFYIKENKLYFTLGDVSGKGVPAALFMAITKSAFRFTTQQSRSLQDIVSQINNTVVRGNKSDMFVTLFTGRINLETMEMEYCNAGHNPIIIISPKGEAQYLRAKANIAVGLFDDFPYQDEKITLQKGSRLLIYTDGVSEAENIRKELYGDDRLLDFAQQINPSETSEEVVGHLLDSLKSFTKEAEQNDDITIMSIKF